MSFQFFETWKRDDVTVIFSMKKTFSVFIGKNDAVTVRNDRFIFIVITMILGNNPHSFVIHAKYAMTGDRKANIVQPIINVQP